MLTLHMPEFRFGPINFQIDNKMISWWKLSPGSLEMELSLNCLRNARHYFRAHSKSSSGSALLKVETTNSVYMDGRGALWWKPVYNGLKLKQMCPVDKQWRTSSKVELCWGDSECLWESAKETGVLWPQFLQKQRIVLGIHFYALSCPVLSPTPTPPCTGHRSEFPSDYSLHLCGKRWFCNVSSGLYSLIRLFFFLFFIMLFYCAINLS